jgi:leader peptidase (prepilin peptidase)/N-methyltransferase
MLRSDRIAADSSHRLARLSAGDAVLIGATATGAVLASLAAAPGWGGGGGAVLAGLMLAIAVIDHRRMIIPDELNGLAFIAGLVAAGAGAIPTPAIAIVQALARAGVMFALFLAFRAGFRRLRGVEGMGLGDVKLAAVAGVWLDWASLPLVVEIAALSALAAALYARLRSEGFDLKGRLPFGAFFAPAIWICWLIAVWRGGWPPA